MTRLQHSPDSHNVKHWSPGRPVKGCAEPNALDALRRAADVWERSQVVREFPTRPRHTSPTGEKARAA